MNFKSFYDLVVEGTTQKILVLEDQSDRLAMMNAYAKKFGLQYDLVPIDNCQEAISYTASNKENIIYYSLDYNLKMGETSESFAKYLSQFTQGENVVIHSDDRSGAGIIQGFLPKAQWAVAPNNIEKLAMR
jgi:hypothetical protein